jgi:hypothetical protein
MNVKLIRMSSGEDVIAEILNETERDILVVQNGIVGIPTGEGRLAFAPWSPLVSKTNKEIEIARRFIVYIAEVDDAIMQQYESMYSTIMTPSKKLIM